MWQTIINQNYLGNLALDTSGNSNHGIPIDVTPEFPGFLFNQFGSRISIPPSVTLSGLGAIQAAVRFVLQPQGAVRRFNLVEGFESFALFVNPDFSIEGTMLDAAGQWSGAQSPPGAVTPGTAHAALMLCDGAGAVQLFLDGKEVGGIYTTEGGVRSVGSLGIAVGHWPDPPAIYTFEGAIFAFTLQKFDPLSELLSLLDACCVSWAGVLRFLGTLSQQGITPTRLAAAGAALSAAGVKSQMALRGGTREGTLRQRAFAVATAGALRQRDLAALETVLAAWAAATPPTLSEGERAALAQAINDALSEFGLSASAWSTLMRLLCLGTSDLKRGGCCRGC